MNKIYDVLDKAVLYPYGKNKTGKRAEQEGATILVGLSENFILRRCIWVKYQNWEKVESHRVFGWQSSQCKGPAQGVCPSCLKNSMEGNRAATKGVRLRERKREISSQVALGFRDHCKDFGFYTEWERKSLDCFEQASSLCFNMLILVVWESRA